MLLLATLLGIVILTAAVAAPPFREEAAEGGEPIDAWPDDPTWLLEPPGAAAANGPSGSGLRAGRGAAPDECAMRRVEPNPIREDRGAAASDGGEEDCPRVGAALQGDDAGASRARDGAALIADFDPAVETIEIAYQGDAPPDLRFVETAGATEVLVDGVVVARMAGVTGLGPAHVSLIAA